MIEMRWLEIDPNDCVRHPSAISIPSQCRTIIRVLQYREVVSIPIGGAVDQEWSEWKDVPIETP